MPGRTAQADRLDVRSRLDDLGRVRDFVTAGAGAAGLSADRVGELVLAVDEAVSNIILHGGAPEAAGLEIRIVRDADSVQVHVRDQGRPFDPTLPVDADLGVSPLERERAGGFGLPLLQRLVDRLDYRRADDGHNELALIMRRPQPGGG